MWEGKSSQFAPNLKHNLLGYHLLMYLNKFDNNDMIFFFSERKYERTERVKVVRKDYRACTFHRLTAT